MERSIKIHSRMNLIDIQIFGFQPTKRVRMCSTRAWLIQQRKIALQIHKLMINKVVIHLAIRGLKSGNKIERIKLSLI